MRTETYSHYLRGIDKPTCPMCGASSQKGDDGFDELCTECKEEDKRQKEEHFKLDAELKEQVYKLFEHIDIICNDFKNAKP